MSRRADERSGWGRWTAFVKLALFALFLLAVPNGALAKIGLDLEWRPIEGLEPPAKEEKPEEKSGDTRASGKAGETRTFTVNGVSFKMVRIPAGEFMMGSPANDPARDNDETQHRVRISSYFWMGQTEVTQGLWKAVMGSNPSKFSNCGDDCPVENVSWNDCQGFIRKLNGRVSGGNFRLPTEAEWEYACRGGMTHPYAGDLDAMGWYGNNSRSKTHGVGQKQSNSWGLYDMHGNVWEWCQDWKGDYPSGSITDPTGPSGGSRRERRGGGWLSDARLCRSANRGSSTPVRRYDHLGFRLARTN
jgi:formylglycine-generating enzyme required for sulfatase activity